MKRPQAVTKQQIHGHGQTFHKARLGSTLALSLGLVAFVLNPESYGAPEGARLFFLLLALYGGASIWAFEAGRRKPGGYSRWGGILGALSGLVFGIGGLASIADPATLLLKQITLDAEGLAAEGLKDHAGLSLTLLGILTVTGILASLCLLQHVLRLALLANPPKATDPWTITYKGGLTVEPAEEEDSPEIARLLFANPDYSYGKYSRGERWDVLKFAKETELFRVIRYGDDQLIGFSKVSPHRDTLVELWVDPKFSGQGAGALLLEDFLVTYRLGKGVEQPGVLIHTSNSEGQEWVRKRGWRLESIEVIKGAYLIYINDQEQAVATIV